MFLGLRGFVHQKLHKSTTENCKLVKLVSTAILRYSTRKPGSAPECSSQKPKRQKEPQALAGVEIPF